MGDSLVFNTKLYNPLFWHLLPLLRNPKIRYIYIEGGSSAAKTFSICQALWYIMMESGINVLAFRRFQVHIKDTIHKSFQNSATSMQLKRYLDIQDFIIKYQAKEKEIRFKGLDSEENIKGIEGFDIIYNNEWNQFNNTQWGQQRKRLRGKPNQKFICDWNPVSTQLWIYTERLDKDEWFDMPLKEKTAASKYCNLDHDFAFKKINKKGDSVWIKVTFRDNFWIVGHPSGEGGFYDEHTIAEFEYDRLHNPNLYRVYANGERGAIRTGGEFWKQFDELKHVRPLKYITGPVHLSCDENVNPYVTVSCWQINVDAKEIKQVHELPCRTPENNAPKAALKTAKWLRSMGHKDVVFVYGDPSGNKRSTIDKNSKSFYDKFIEVLQNEGFIIIKRVAKSAPQVALSASFINEIYEANLHGWTIVIGDHCKVSIDDYITVKEDADGSMKKTKVKDEANNVTYEPHGHFSDAKRYFIIKALEHLFNQYKSKTKRGGKSIAV